MRWAQLNIDTSISTKEQTKRRGFTIVELLIVIVVIAILAAISVVAYTGIQNRARGTQIESELSGLARALEIYRVDEGHYPAQHADFNVFRSTGVKFKQHSAVPNTFLYCIDPTNAQSWLLLAYGYPNETGSHYRWGSDGSRSRGVGINSGTTTCQGQMDGSSSVVGVWASSLVTLY